MLPLCKFYRYLIYRLYHFRDDTPITNTIITLTSVHLMQLLTILLALESFTPIKLDLNLGGNRVLFITIFSVLNFLLLYNKKKWKTYDEEFKDETPEHKKKGLVIVLSYLIGSVIIFIAFHIIIGFYQDSLK